LPILDDLLTLGMKGLANVEPNAMDIVEIDGNLGEEGKNVGIEKCSPLLEMFSR
jgi:hypothetical protein